MKTDPACIFCKIVLGQSPCFKLFEDEYTLAILSGLVADRHCNGTLWTRRQGISFQLDGDRKSATTSIKARGAAHSFTDAAIMYVPEDPEVWRRPCVSRDRQRIAAGKRISPL